MFDQTDTDKLQNFLKSYPEYDALFQRVLQEQELTLRTISHEIRNPLTLIYSTIQQIELTHPEVQTSHHWSYLKEDTEFLIQLLNELSSLNNGNRLHLSSFSFCTFLRKLSLTFATSILDTDISYSSKIPDDLPFLNGDIIKLKEVFLNLLCNAKDAVLMNPHSPHRIRLHAYHDYDSNHIVTIIEDTGCGIRKEDLQDIFHPFITHKPHGTGLGLPIARRITEAHHGKLLLSSIPQAGTIVTVILPAFHSL